MNPVTGYKLNLARTFDRILLSQCAEGSPLYLPILLIIECVFKRVRKTNAL